MPVNLKVCLPTLLLFFLFGDRSASALSFRPPRFPLRTFQELRPSMEDAMEGAKSIHDKYDAYDKVGQIQDFFKIFRSPPSSPPNSPPLPDNITDSPCTPIENLSQLKEYLSDYGYIDNSPNFTDCMDSEMVSAIKSYQQFFNLPITGDLDKDTIDQLSLRRCGVPDINVTYHLSTASNDDVSVSWPNGTEWFGNRRSLTYCFDPENSIPPKFTKVFSDSFQLWSDAIRVLNLTETSSFDDADIKIGFYINTTGAEVVGDTIIVQERQGNSFGTTVLDAAKFVQPITDGADSVSLDDEKVDLLETVVMHQIGHLLGLSHSSDVDSVMYPSVNENLKTVKLSDGDQQQIQRLYSSSDDNSAGGGGVASNDDQHENHQGYSSGACGLVIGSSWGLLTTLSLGFSAMVLFN